MSTETAVEPPPTTLARRRPLLKPPETAAKNVRHRGSRVGETAGECAAVCCCCPCAVAHLLILAVYRLPRGIWRKKRRKIMLRKKRKILSEEKKDFPRKISSEGDDDDDRESTDRAAKNDAVVEWNDEMWDRFGDGFWRSGSQRQDD